MEGGNFTASSQSQSTFICVRAASNFGIACPVEDNGEAANQSLATSTFPDAWKEAIVLPLPKVKAPSSVSELRPISVLPALSKIMEKLVVSQMVQFL
ncbi:hypothetical protein J6590_092640 [Homalodisca vitripennis]|nr:hypothetical protein J6590_092640 [Homalodisca vitripennis]